MTPCIENTDRKIQQKEADTFINSYLKKVPGRLPGRKLIPAFFILTLLLLDTAAAFSDRIADKEKSFRVTGFGEVLFNDDHNSEGFLAPLSNGNILHIFRLDPGIEGNHVGANGYIAQITYFPEEDRWGDLKPVYNSHKYDDRNIHGGVTRDGRIVVFFRHLYQGNGERYTEGRYFIYSDDDGTTWSSPMKSTTWSDPDMPDKRFGVWGTGQMFYNEDSGRYSMLGYGRHVTYITYSYDGKSWEEINPVRVDPDAALTEIAGAWTGNNTLIALIRDDARAHGHPLLQTVSRDNGATWTEPEKTNIPYDMHWGCAPQLIYDQKRDLLIGVTSDRYSRKNKNRVSLSTQPGLRRCLNNRRTGRLNLNCCGPGQQMPLTGVGL
jgi:hypothetical protein